MPESKKSNTKSKAKQTQETTPKVDLANAQQQAEVKLAGLEKQLDEIFVKKSPVQLPKGAKDWIVQYSPYISLIIGILGLWSVSVLWKLGHSVNELANWANQLSLASGGKGVETYHMGLFWWIALVVMAVQAVIQILAYPGLRDRKKSGWNLLFYSSLLSVVTGVAFLFVDQRGFGSFIGQLIGAAIGLYILFQIRSYYTAKGAKSTKKA